MHVILEVLAGILGTGAVALSLSVGIVLRRLRRANRLVPDRRTPAPLWWRWSPRRAAQLHRRLQRSCALVLMAAESTERKARRRRRGTPPSMLAAAADELVERALRADGRLADAGRRGPAWRRVQLSALAAEVRAVEAGAHRLTRLRAEIEAAAAPEPAEDLLDAYEAALADLRP